MTFAMIRLFLLFFIVFKVSCNTLPQTTPAESTESSQQSCAPKLSEDIIQKLLKSFFPSATFVSADGDCRIPCEACQNKKGQCLMYQRPQITTRQTVQRRAHNVNQQHDASPKVYNIPIQEMATVTNPFKEDTIISENEGLDCDNFQNASYKQVKTRSEQQLYDRQGLQGRGEDFPQIVSSTNQGNHQNNQHYDQNIYQNIYQTKEQPQYQQQTKTITKESLQSFVPNIPQNFQRNYHYLPANPQSSVKPQLLQPTPLFERGVVPNAYTPNFTYSRDPSFNPKRFSSDFVSVIKNKEELQPVPSQRIRKIVSEGIKVVDVSNPENVSDQPE